MLLHTYCKVFLVPGLCTAGQIGSSLMALPLVSIATVVAMRNLCTCVVATIEWAFFGEKMSLATVLALVTVVVGMTVYTGADHAFNATGYFWLAVNGALTVTSTIYSRVFVKKYTATKQQTASGISFIVQTETLPIALFLAFVNKEGSAPAALFSLGLGPLLIIALTCGGGLMIGQAYPKCYSLASGTAVVVASTANKAAAIVIGMFVFGTVFTPTQVLGLVVCVGGALMYAVEQKSLRGGRSLLDGVEKAVRFWRQGDPRVAARLAGGGGGGGV
eukprot:g2217.t1